MKSNEKLTKQTLKYQSMDQLNLCVTKRQQKTNRTQSNTFKLKNKTHLPFHASSTILYNNPHKIKQRNQILQIQSQNYLIYQTKKKRLFRIEEEFLVSCGKGDYDVKGKLENCNILPGSNNQKINSNTKTNTNIKIDKNSKIEISEMGQNIIKFNEWFKFKAVQPFTTTLPQQGKLTIRGNFQSGNFNKYIQLDTNQYGLILNQDTNTQGYTQWFQFFIRYNPTMQQKRQQLKEQKDKILKFVILNIRKPIRYIPEMKLLTKSYKQQTRSYEQWHRNLAFTFFQTNLEGNDGRKYYAIAFCVQVNVAKHGIFVALSHPYPFSRVTCLSQQMNNIQSQFKTYQIGKSTLFNPILLFNNTNLCKKKNIFIIARQHASQTSSSFISQYIIKRLSLFNCYDYLVKQLNWHIIPIANPDGVIHGNSRTTCRGYDMNRCWAPYLVHCSSQIQAINGYIDKLNLTQDDIFLDLHGHSRQLGLFSFTNSQNSFIKYFNQKMSQICPYFDIQKCKSGYISQKRNTFRVQMLNRYKIKNIITLQTSYYGYICKQNNQIKQYINYDYQKIAVSLLKCIQAYLKNQVISNTTGNRVQNLDLLLQRIDRKQTREQNKKNQYQSQSQSDTDPQRDYLDQADRRQLEEYFKQKKNLKNNKNKSLYYISDCNQQKSQYRLKIQQNLSAKRKRQLNQSNIVNLFKGVNSTVNKLKESSERTIRAYSAFSRANNSQKIQNKKYNDLSSYKLQQHLTQNLKTQSFAQRKSFKNLFACAQFRNSQYLNVKKQPIKINQVHDPKMKKATISNFQFNFQQEQTPSKEQKFKSIIFPGQFSTYGSQYQKQIKAVEQTFYKRNPTKAIKNFNFDKKLKIAKNAKQFKQFKQDKEATNQKIAKLCQYVKKIQKRTIFS